MMVYDYGGIVFVVSKVGYGDVELHGTECQREAAGPSPLSKGQTM